MDYRKGDNVKDDPEPEISERKWDYQPCPGSISVDRAVSLSRHEDDPEEEPDIYPVNYP